MAIITITKQVKQGDSVSIKTTPNTGYEFNSYSGSINGTTTGGRTQENGNNPLSFNASTNSNITANFKSANEGRIEIRWYNSVNEPGYGYITRTSASLNTTNKRGVKRIVDYGNAISISGTLNSGRWTGYYEGNIAGFAISDISSVGFTEEGGVYPGSSRSNVYYADFSACTSMTQFGNSGNDQQFYYHNTIETVKLPSSIQSIYFTAFAGSNIKTLYIYATTPPSISGSQYSSGDIIFSGCSNLRRIYVPAGSVNAYKSATAWSYYSDKITAIIDVSSEVNPANSGTVSKAASETSELSNTQSSALDGLILTASGNSGYSFRSWNRGNTVLSTSNPYTLYSPDNINGTDNIIAEFLSTYTISASVNPNGGGTVSGAGTYNHGTSCTLTATSNTGYDFVNWTEDGSTVSSSSSYTFTATQNRTLVANFELQTITISAGPNTSGYGTVSGNSGTYSYGDTVSLTATAASGYEFSEWTENGTAVSSSSTYTFTATQDRTLVAVFIVSVPAKSITITTTGDDSVILKNNSDQTYTWNLSSGTNTYRGTQSGFAIDDLKSVYKFVSTDQTKSDNIITSVDLSETEIESIPSYAFCGCTALTSFTFPDTLTTISTAAFTGCTSLTTFTIPSSVNYITRNAFQNTGWWNNYQDGAVYYKDNICIGYHVSNSFRDVIGDLVIQSGTRIIASDAFTGSTNIYSLTLNNGLQRINSSAFYNCSKIHELYIPESVIEIGVAAFYGTGLYNDWASNSMIIVDNCVLCCKGSVSGDVEFPYHTRLIATQAMNNALNATSFNFCNPVPPIINTCGLSNTYSATGVSATPIYVPSGSVNAYKTSSNGMSYYASTITAATEYTITVSKGQNAELSPEYKNPTFSGGGTYPKGAEITISMTSPSTQYTVAQWYNQTETVQGNYDTWTKYSLDGHYVDANTITYTVKDHNETIYCNVFSAGGNSIYCRHFETYDDPMMIASIPAFDCYDSNDNLLGTWTGAMDQGVNCPFTASSVYKLVNHVEYIETEWDPGNPMPVYSNFNYLESADFSGLTNLHEIDGYGGSSGYQGIAASSFILPPSCKVLKNMYFGPAQMYDEYSQQTMWYYPRQVNFGNVEEVDNVIFDSSDMNNGGAYLEMTLWDGEGNYGIRQWAVSTYSINNITGGGFGYYNSYQPELYYPNCSKLITPDNTSGYVMPALTKDGIYITPNIKEVYITGNYYSGSTLSLPNTVEVLHKFPKGSITFNPNSHLHTISYNCFTSNTNLTTIDIPYSCTSIGDSAFSGCTNLTTLTGGFNVKTLGGSAFRNCRSLTKIMLNRLGTINTYTFYGCTAMTKLYMPSLTSIGQYSLVDCNNLTTVKFGNYYTVSSAHNPDFGTAIPGPLSINTNTFASLTGITSIYLNYLSAPTPTTSLTSSKPNSTYKMYTRSTALSASDWSTYKNALYTTTSSNRFITNDEYMNQTVLRLYDDY